MTTRHRAGRSTGSSGCRADIALWDSGCSSGAMWRGGGLLGLWLRMVVVLAGCLSVKPQSQQHGRGTALHLPLKDVRGTVREYCEREGFNATCAAGEVVMIQSARYGRMREGRCITSAYGTVGCSRDVLSHLDVKCSGRQSCIGPVGNLVPLDVQPCPGDFRSYLEASFECVKVASSGGNPNLCQASSHVAIRNQEGYLSNYIADTSKLGSLDCPWLIEMAPGQTIKLTLLDFGGRDSRDQNICHVYATIKEAAASTSETVCASRHRSTLVYTSSTNVVEVRLVTKRDDTKDATSYFLIKYEAVGCGDPKKPQNGWLQRNGDLVTLGCNYNDDRWTLRCKGHHWIGDHGNCTDRDGTTAGGGIGWGKINFPSGLSIILIMCIALFIGIVILTVGLLCLKRRHLGSNPHRAETPLKPEAEVYNSYRHTSPRQHGHTTSSSPQGVVPPLVSQQQQPHQHQHTFPRVGHLPKPPNSPFDTQPENDYSRTWQMQRHPPGGGGPRNVIGGGNRLPPTPGSGLGGVGGGGYGIDPRTGSIVTGGGGALNGYHTSHEPNYDAHVYESPKFERHELHSGSDEGSSGEHVTPGSAQYYELDPEQVPLDCGPAPVHHAMRDVTGTSIDDQRMSGRNPLIPNYQIK